jgi:acetyl-CoA synthetase (ADP-forming)
MRIAPYRFSAAERSSLDSEIALVISAAKKENRCNLFEHEAFRLFSLYRIPTPQHKFAENVDEAVIAAEQIGYPVVMKIVSSEILHKTESGGVVLGITSENELRVGFKRIVANARSSCPRCRIRGVLVESMIPQGVETIIGALRDDQFGTSVMFGLGGIFTEVAKDVSFRVAPISRFDAEDLVDDLRFSAVLKGYRGRAPSDRNAIIDILLRTCRLMAEVPEIESLDLNPVIVHETGAIAVDGRILLANSA